MPLEIDYRPVNLPPAPPAPRGAAPVVDEVAPAIAANPRAAGVQTGGRLRQRANLRWRIGLVVLLGVLPALLAVLGWGDPRGIGVAVAQTQGGPWHANPTPAVAARPGSAAPAATSAAWDRSLANVHSDADIAALPTLQPGPAARAMLPAGSGLDRARALQCMTTAIYYEAAREPDDGQRAVAQVVLNRVAHPAFPKTVCGVVYQGSERPGCQFSFACDGALARAPMATYWLRARRVAEAALAGYVYTPVGLATHYHTSAVHPGWADAMTFIGTIGAHRFYRWSGSAGLPRAFNATYAGGEPIAAPHPRTWVSTGADFADPLALEKAFEAGRLAALRANPAPIAPSPTSDPAIVRAGPAFGQLPLPHATVPAAGNPILPGSGTLRPDAERQYDSAAHWIHQPGA
jgi:spore germination cell wall hydrolase CwlJ-like protein